ncbi:MAG: 50S ribosomal protein L23 [Hymenobacteraceae bacterium]|nr:50S ribosomal protein L23 [Hymenobacteraceae bacterium]
MNPTHILKRPIVTEKMTGFHAAGRYAFEVDRAANKIEIRTAIEKLYGVTVVAVNTLRYSGKVKSRNTRGGSVSGRRPSGKKAIVTLKEGEVIDFYNGI